MSRTGRAASALATVTGVVALMSALGVLEAWGAWAEGGSARRSALRRGDRAAVPAPVLGGRGRCQAYGGLPPGWRRTPVAGMVRVEGGRFVPGSTRGYADERPGAAVDVPDFWIDRTEVTNAQFADFVAATGYVTEAERGAAVGALFEPPPEEALRPGAADWWRADRGATWRRPDGVAVADTASWERQPVVQVTYADAQAYATWLGRQLPTEAQWEFAARGGVATAGLADAGGAPRDAAGRPAANYWQGDFPLQDRGDDGFAGRAPVGCFAANALGLHDTIGNVWEWTRDAYRAQHAPGGGEPGGCHTSDAAGGEPRVIKGGSYLCAATFCARYRASARHPQDPGQPTAHIGFRTVRAASGDGA